MKFLDALGAFIFFWVIFSGGWMLLGSFINWSWDNDHWIWGNWLNRLVILAATIFSIILAAYVVRPENKKI